MSFSKISNSPPPRWINCPRKGQIIADIFLPFKTPLDFSYNTNIPEEKLFHPSTVIKFAKLKKLKLGLWVDLTNTNRYYKSTEISSNNIEYFKLACRGLGQAPSEDQTQKFIEKVSYFVAKHPGELIAVHCTHGFNRTGFLICAYMIDQLDWSPNAAIMAFAQARPPGIYKQEYLNELFARCNLVTDTPEAPDRPDWDLQDGPEMNEQDESGKTNSHIDFDNPTGIEPQASSKSNDASYDSSSHAKFVMVEGCKIEGIEQVTDNHELASIRAITKELADFQGKSFPGSQPVSMTIQNLAYLSLKPYKVSWKADGQRYMMLIHGNLVCLIDRDNRYYKVHNLNFPKRKDPDNCLEHTLLDGEMVIDTVDEKQIPRYLIYDIISIDSQKVGQMSFDIRLICIEKEIMQARHTALQSGRFDKSSEPFGIRAKTFWPLLEAQKLWCGNFSKQLSHAMDGLVFQPVNEAYKNGRWDELLKWKPPDLNSVDFKLKIVTETSLGMVPEKKGYLYVGGYDKPFAHIKVTKELRQYTDKIIECKVEGNHWAFMRERTDKSFPNHISTVRGVWESIHNPVTADILFNYIASHAFLQFDRSLVPLTVQPFEHPSNHTNIINQAPNLISDPNNNTSPQKRHYQNHISRPNTTIVNPNNYHSQDLFQSTSHSNDDDPTSEIDEPNRTIKRLKGAGPV